MELNKSIKTLLATAAMGAILALTPVALDFGVDDGLTLKVSQAFADSGNSGSGGGDDNDDSGSDDSGSDDNSSSGGSGDDSSDDGDSSGRDKPRIPGGSGCDDAGDIAEHPECGGAAGGAGGTGGQSEFFLNDGTKVEISNGGLNIEVKYTDGSKEEIQFGRYERKDTNNNTVEERAATADDVARLQAVING